jgi:hypothetical protein
MPSLAPLGQIIEIGVLDTRIRVAGWFILKQKY